MLDHYHVFVCSIGSILENYFEEFFTACSRNDLSYPVVMCNDYRNKSIVLIKCYTTGQRSGKFSAIAKNFKLCSSSVRNNKSVTIPLMNTYLAQAKCLTHEYKSIIMQNIGIQELYGLINENYAIRQHWFISILV